MRGRESRSLGLRGKIDETPREPSELESALGCVVCRAGIAAEKKEPGFGTLCHTCGLLLKWFRGLYDEFEEPDVIRGLNSETTFLDLACDSLDYLEIRLEVEEKFGITFTDEEGERFRLVGDLFRLIRDRVPIDELKSGLSSVQWPRDPDPLWDRDLDV